MSESVRERMVSQWKEALALLQQSLEMYESGQMSLGEKEIGTLTEERKERLRQQITELDVLINEHST